MDMKLAAKKKEVLKAFEQAHGHHYEVFEGLGDGNYGFTFRCRDKHRDMDVCIKFFKHSNLGKGYLRDWQVTSTIHNDLINPTFSVERFNDEFGNQTVAVVSSFVKGKTLSDLLAVIENNGKAQDIRDSLYRTVFLDLVRAVSYLHSKGHGHGDLHQKNVMVKHEGDTLKPVIIDFDNATVGGLMAESEEELKLRDLASLRQTLSCLLGSDEIGNKIKDVFEKAESATTFLNVLEIILKFYDATSFCGTKRFSPQDWDQSCRSLTTFMMVSEKCYPELWNFREFLAAKFGQTDELTEAKHRFADHILNDRNAIRITGTITSSSDPFEIFKSQLFTENEVEM